MRSAFPKACVFLGLLILWVGLLFVVSHLSNKTLNDLGFTFWDKAAHFVVYIPVGFFAAAFLLFRKGRPRGKTGRMLVLLTLIVTLSAFDEIHQLFVPGRSASVLDVVADVLGACLGGGLGTWLLTRKKS